MATAPEEFLVESLKETIPPSPSIYLNLPPMPDDGNTEGQLYPNDLMLPYISHLLMEDDTDENHLNQYSDHPALLQVEKPFAEILFSPSFGTDNKTGTTTSSLPLHVGDKGNTEEDNVFSLLKTNCDRSKHSSVLSKGADAADLFLKGMEEASRLLPKCSGFIRDELVDKYFYQSCTPRGAKKRYNQNNHLEEHKVRRARKYMFMVKEMKENYEIFDDMMLRACEACIRDIETLRVAMASLVIKNNRKQGNKVATNTVDLRTLLIHCAQALTAGNHVGAGAMLKQIKQHASPKGDATQRLAQCFAEGLEARLAGTGSHVYSLYMAKCPSVGEFLKAYKLFMAASGFYKVALIFNIMTIMHAMEGKNRLHIVEFGTNFGLQWSSLLYQLAKREGGPPEVRITSIGCHQPRPLPSESIEETRHRLSSCASQFGLPFKFHSIEGDWEAVCIDDLNTNADEVLVVSDLFNLSTLMDDTIFYDKPSPKDTVLQNIRNMRPDVFIQSIVNCSSGTSFLTRFREALFYFAALFDMLDATIPRESEARLVLEQGLLGHCALNVIACEGADLMDRPEKYRYWQVRNQRAGLRQLPLNSNIIRIMRNRVRNRHHKDFLLSEDDQWLIHGWMGRVLFAHSTWVANDAASSQ
ncbi:hypothetical protein ACP70R_000121 [Stipagrostis hirtigluma subsp. patula]